MTLEILIKEHLVHIMRGSEFAILQRTPNDEGMLGITFSIPATPCMADLLDKSGIVETVNYSYSGTISFRRKNFYETHLMIELIIDILEKYETNKETQTR